MTTDLFAPNDALVRAKAAREPHDILARAAEATAELFQAEPVIVCLFSGGTDSMMAAEVAMQHPRFLCAAQWDTRTGLPAVLEWSDEWAASQGFDLVRIPTPEDYRSLVLGETAGVPGGFPYRKAMHGVYQNRLKDRARAGFQRHLVESGALPKGVPVLYVSGIRGDESEERKKLLKKGPFDIRYRYRTARGERVRESRPRREVHVTPLLYVDAETKARHFYVRGWQANPAARALGFSAECMCMCGGTAQQEAQARAFDPAWGEARRVLEDQVREAGYPWGPGQTPPKGWHASDIGMLHAEDTARAESAQQDLFMSLCGGSCERRLRMERQAAEVAP